MKFCVLSGPVRVGCYLRQILGSTAIFLIANTSIADASDSIGQRSGRDQLAQTLSGIETVEVTDVALAAAPKGSLFAKLGAYQRARRALEAAVAAQNDAYADYKDLAAMHDARSSEAGQGADRETEVIAAAHTYNWYQERAQDAQLVAQSALSELTDGQPLSDAAMMELHGLLGL